MDFLEKQNVDLITRKPSKRLTAKESYMMNVDMDIAKDKYDYIVCLYTTVMYSIIETRIYRAKDYNDIHKVIRPMTKPYGSLNKCIKSIKSLVKAGMRYDASNLMLSFAHRMPYYHKQYVAEGTSYLSTISYNISNALNDDIVAIENRVRNLFIKNDTPDTELCVNIQTASIICSMVVSILDCCSESLKIDLTDIVHKRYGQYQKNIKTNFSALPEFDTLKAHVRGLVNYLTKDNVSVDAEDVSFVNDTKTKILKKLFSHSGIEEMENKVFFSITKDYADFCIACMLIHYRQNRELEKEVADTLNKYGYGNRELNAIMQEFDEADICYGEHDPHEVKAYIDDIKHRTQIDKLRRTLDAGITDE